MVNFASDAPEWPRRVANGAWARARFGELADRCLAAIERVDPVADELVAWLAEGGEIDLRRDWRAFEAGAELPGPVRALFESVANTPEWVDWAQIDRAGALLERSGIAGGLVLSLRSLMGGYLAPVGNKPLVFSGRLREQAPRRVAETARFVTAVCSPGGARPGAEGWRIALHVRLMHAQVRRLLLQSGRWDHEAWSAPINQHDMLGTMLLFSEVFVEGLRILGFVVSEAEAEDWIALWRYVAWVMGTEAELLPRDYAEAEAMRALILGTQGTPDEDSRALAAALIEHVTLAARELRELEPFPELMHELRRRLAHGLGRKLLDEGPADDLGLERPPVIGAALELVPLAVGAVEQLRLREPALDRRIRAAGRRYWDWVVDASLGDRPATFARPARLRET